MLEEEDRDGERMRWIRDKVKDDNYYEEKRFGGGEGGGCLRQKVLERVDHDP